MKVIELREYGGPEVLEAVERPMPQPTSHEVRVCALAIGVGSADTLIRNGTYHWMPPLPAVPGNELAGVIDAVGEAVPPALIGRHVLVSSRELPQRGGCYAEVVCAPADAVYPLPSGIAARDAVTLPNYQLAGALLYQAGMRRPRSLLVHGAAGGVATALIQLALADGILPIGTVSSRDKLAFARAAGAPYLILRSVEDVPAAVSRITQGRGVDAVYAIAGPGFTRNLELLAPLGTLVSFNSLSGSPDTDLFAELKRLLGKSLGVRCYSIHTLDAEPATRRALMERAISLMATGRLRPPPPTLMPLVEARRAHALLDSGANIGKIVLTPGSTTPP